jgi:hypothetical protein
MAAAHSTIAIMRFTCTVVAASGVAILPYSGTARHIGEEAFTTAWSNTTISKLPPVPL